MSSPDSIIQAVHFVAGVCPAAPPGLQHYQDQLFGWIKWGVIVMIIATALVSAAAIVVGRIFAVPHAVSRGAIGVAASVTSAVLLVTVLAVINGVIASGCQ